MLHVVSSFAAGVNLTKKSGVNYTDLTKLSKDQEITAISWAQKEGEDKVVIYNQEL